jgi:hypothetical protein
MVDGKEIRWIGHREKLHDGAVIRLGPARFLWQSNLPVGVRVTPQPRTVGPQVTPPKKVHRRENQAQALSNTKRNETNPRKRKREDDTPPKKVSPSKKTTTSKTTPVKIKPEPKKRIKAEKSESDEESLLKEPRNEKKLVRARSLRSTKVSPPKPKKKPVFSSRSSDSSSSEDNGDEDLEKIVHDLLRDRKEIEIDDILTVWEGMESCERV